MFTEENKKIEKIAIIIGYLLNYFLFTTILFIILVLFKKIPEVWSYTHVMGITAFIALLGIIIRGLLK